MEESPNVTGLLRKISHGDRQAFDRLVPIVYDSLRRLAHQALRHERPGHTLSTTALAHEAYLELVGLNRIDWQDRSHFFAVAAQAMRRVLVDYAVARKAQKRGGGAVAVDVDELAIAIDDRLDEILRVNQALDRLESIDPRAVRVVECRVLMGMNNEETASVLEVSPATVKRQWSAARAWLNRELTSR